jgi:hypothetical protein
MVLSQTRTLMTLQYPIISQAKSEQFREKLQSFEQGLFKTRKSFEQVKLVIYHTFE